MTTRRHRLLVAALLVCGAASASVVRMAAQPATQYTAWGSVQELEAGWGEDTMSVRHSAPVVNPGACPITTAGYASSPADTGHSLYHTLLLSGFLNRKEVALLISGCSYGNPRVIAVKLLDAPPARIRRSEARSTHIASAAIVDCLDGPAAQCSGKERFGAVPYSPCGSTSTPPRCVLRRGAPDVLGARAFRSLADVEFDAVPLPQILEAFPIDGALMKEVLLPRLILDEPEPFVDA